MKSRVPFWSGLRVRVVLGIAVPLLIILGLAAQLQYTRQRELVLANMQEISASVGESVDTALTRAMLGRDRAQLNQVAQDLAARSSIRNALILDHKGIVRVATNPPDLETAIPINDPACATCHAPHGKETSRNFIATVADGSRVFRTVTPILNQAACQTCHGTGATINGILIIDLALEPIEANLQADLWQNLMLSLVTILVVALLIFFLLDRMVLTRLERFRWALTRYARGDFAARVPVAGSDEIGTLAGTMNAMAEGLEEKAKLEQEVERASKKLAHESLTLSALYRVALESSRSLNLTDVMQAGLKNSLAAIEMQSGEIRLLEPDTKRLQLRAWTGGAPEIVQQSDCAYRENCLCYRVAQRGELAVRQFPGSESDDTCPVCRAPGPHTAAFVPLRAHGRILGVMALHHSGARDVSSDDIALLNTLGDQLGIAIDNAQLYAEMESRVDELSRQVQHLAVLEERDRLAREMHDGFAQALALLHLKLSAASGTGVNNGQVESALQEMREIVDRTFEDVRQAIGDLRTPLPPASSFVNSLADYVQTFALRYNLQAQVIADPTALQAHCTPDVEIQVMRIVQETMANVRKHAAAEHIRVEFARHDSTLNIRMQDDGQGFDPAATARTTGHFGLAIMRERAASFGGALNIKGDLGIGTTIELCVPLTGEPVHP